MSVTATSGYGVFPATPLVEGLSENLEGNPMVTNEKGVKKEIRPKPIFIPATSWLPKTADEPKKRSASAIAGI